MEDRPSMTFTRMGYYQQVCSIFKFESFNTAHQKKAFKSIMDAGNHLFITPLPKTAKAKIKIEQGKQTKKKIRAPEMFEKKNSCRDFSIGKIISWCVYYIYIIIRCSVRVSPKVGK